MGLFSIFTKKSDDEPEPGDLPLRRPDATSTRLPRDIEAERARQREIARATAAKIDAIEYAMTFEIFNGADTTMAGANGSAAKPQAAVPGTAAPAMGASPATRLATPTTLAQDNGATTVFRGGPNSGLGGMDDDIEPTLLLPDDDGSTAPPSPAIEESAMLYANGQQDVAEQLLQDAINGPDGEQRALWAMLFDLYQASGNQAGFERLAMDFASRFETSPPSWIAAAPTRTARRHGPSASLSGALDEHCATVIDGLLAQAPGNALLQLDVSAVTYINSDACAHLLAALDKLHALDIELVLVGTDNLLAAVENRTRVGERGSGPAPWLLRLALLQLTAQDEAFDQVAMDYCITHEVSPPSYVAPPRVTIAGAADDAAELPQQYAMPALLDQAQLEGIAAHAALAEALQFDCSALARADYGAATALLGQLRPLRAEGRDISFHELNHLVAALFRLVGIDGVATLYTRKY